MNAEYVDAFGTARSAADKGLKITVRYAASSEEFETPIDGVARTALRATAESAETRVPVLIVRSLCRVEDPAHTRRDQCQFFVASATGGMVGSRQPTDYHEEGRCWDERVGVHAREIGRAATLAHSESYLMPKKPKITPARAEPTVENRRARHDYTIHDTLEVGIKLHGSEVKAVRAGRMTLGEGYVTAEISPLGLHLHNANIGDYDPAGPSRRHTALLHTVVEKL